MLPADKKIFRLVRKLLWAAEVQRRLPAALRRRKERAVAEDGAEGGGLEEEAEAEGAQWLGMWPILDPSALGARRADSDAPRWQAVVAASSHGASGGEGTRRRPSAMGLRFMLRSGVPLDGLFGLACCPLCGQAGVPLDVRHVLSGECDAGASAEERAHAAALLQGLEAKLPLGADAHEGAGRHDAALARELRLAARVLGAAGGAVPRGETSDEEWWMAARLASGMPPGLGPGARAAILSEAEAKDRSGDWHILVDERGVRCACRPLSGACRSTQERQSLTQRDRGRHTRQHVCREAHATRCVAPRLETTNDTSRAARRA